MQRVVLVLLILLAGVGAWWFGFRDTAGPAGTGTHHPVQSEHAPQEPPQATDGSPELEASGAPKGEADTVEPDPAPAPENSVTVKGRVLDPRRRPVGGATLTLVASGEGQPVRTAVSGADGRFALSGLVRPEAGAWRAFFVRATHGDRAGLGGSGLWAQSEDTIDIGEIGLRDAHTLDVLVRNAAGVPLADAQVVLQSRVGWMRSSVDRAQTGGDGTCHFAELPEQVYRVLARTEGYGRAVTTVRFPQVQPGPVVLTLGPPRELVVVVTDKDTGEPIEGAGLHIEEHIAGVLGAAGQVVPYVPTIDGLLTDGQGRATLPGIGPDDGVQVHAVKDGYPGPGRSRTMRASPVVDGEIRIQLRKLRQVKWPISADSEHTPPEGTALKLEQAKGAVTADLPTYARIEGDHVVAENCNPGVFHVVALAPDGAYAPMMVRHNTNVGREVKFLRPQRVEVIVEQADGTPAQDIYVSMRNQGNMVVIDPTKIGEDGRLELEVRYAWLLDVFISSTPDPYVGVAIGSIDLRKGGGTIRGTLPPPGPQAELTILIDGEPRLPPTYTLRYAQQTPSDVEEDPDKGVVRFRLPAGVPHLALSAIGFLQTTVKFPAVEGDGTARATVELSRGGHCIVRVKPPADGQHRSNLRSLDTKSPGFALQRMGAMPEQLGSKDGWSLVRHGPLTPGRYAAFDSLSGAQTQPIEVHDGEEATLDLDLSTVRTIKGVVEVPEGHPVHQARVQAKAEGLYKSPFPGRQAGAQVRRDGRFQIRVPGDRAVRLVVTHPTLIPAPEGGSVDATGVSTDVRLTLIEGGSATFRLDPPLEAPRQAGRTPALQVQLHAGEPDGKSLRSLTPAVADGVFTLGGFAPGTYTLVIDARQRAPVVIRDVTLTGDRTDLGTINASKGATVRIKLKIKEGEDAPRIYASAYCKGPIAHSRYVNSRGELEVLLRGLGVGTYELRASPMRGMGGGGARTALHETIESDGATEIVRELDLR